MYLSLFQIDFCIVNDFIYVVFVVCIFSTQQYIIIVSWKFCVHVYCIIVLLWHLRKTWGGGGGGGTGMTNLAHVNMLKSGVNFSKD